MSNGRRLLRKNYLFFEAEVCALCVCVFFWGEEGGWSLQKIEFIEVSGFEEQFNIDSVCLGNFFKVGS